MSKGTAFTPSAYRRSPVRRTAPCCRRPERSRPGSPRTGLRPWGGQAERLNFSRSCSSHEERGRAYPTRASATLLRRVRASSLSLDAPGKAYAASHSSHLARCTSMAARASSPRRALFSPPKTLHSHPSTVSHSQGATSQPCGICTETSAKSGLNPFRTHERPLSHFSCMM